MVKIKKPEFVWASPDRQTYIHRQVHSKTIDSMKGVSFTEFVKEINDLEKKLISEGCVDIVIDIDYDEWSMSFDIYATRPETDEEWNLRLKDQAQIKENQKKSTKDKKAAEKRLYERLKKKFEK